MTVGWYLLCVWSPILHPRASYHSKYQNTGWTKSLSCACPSGGDWTVQRLGLDSVCRRFINVPVWICEFAGRDSVTNSSESVWDVGDDTSFWWVVSVVNIIYFIVMTIKLMKSRYINAFGIPRNMGQMGYMKPDKGIFRSHIVWFH